ncbi:MAG: Mrp/NBP35 family ATP-binding protein [Verrucomicrobiota bacterium]|jgi:ATP-binding protein involved in chromosome partitioning|nr:Mrp/NBP35 family ATP-binding protein [Verrucomicrobiota bacterium]HCF93832.1 chromosome partitioning protein [Verrucomicrobiota bacterium]
MSISESQIAKVLEGIKYPGYSRNIISFGLVKEVEVDGNDVRIRLAINSQDPSIPEQIKTEVEAAVAAVEGVGGVEIVMEAPAPKTPGIGSARAIPGVEHVIAVASGKGGVGKSTVATNLACALAQLGFRTGLLDSDIYGPSIPTMMGVKVKPRVLGDRLEPVPAHGVKLMSLGFLIEEDTPVIWRGPMIVKTLTQFVQDVNWAPLDFLIVDLPPGTGDAQLTLAQTIPVEGAVIVSTPQDVALIDAKKGSAMFGRLQIPVLGIVENMSYFRCPDCSSRHEIFGNGGARKEANRQGVRFLGEVPIEAGICTWGDKGVPIVVQEPESESAKAFLEIARAVQAAVATPAGSADRV